MRAFAWTDKYLVKIIREDGCLIEAFEPRTTITKLKAHINKFAKDCEVEWLDRPWNEPGFKEAMRLYEVINGMRFDCKEF